MVSPVSFMRSVSWYLHLALYCHSLWIIFIKKCRKCVNNGDNFFFICGEVTFASRKCSIAPTVKKAHFLYFCCKVGDQKNNDHHTCATLRVHSNSMRGWMEIDLVYCLECPWVGGCLPITVVNVISAWCSLLKILCEWRNNHDDGPTFLPDKFCYVVWWRRQCFFKQRRTAAISFKRCRLLAMHSLVLA